MKSGNMVRLGLFASVLLAAGVMAGLQVAKRAPVMDIGGAPGFKSLKIDAMAKDDAIDFADWRLQCFQAEGRRGPCRIFQRLTAKEDGQARMVLTAALVMVRQKPPEGGAEIVLPVMRFVAPAGVHLPTGLVMRVDESKPRKVPYQVCTPAGCVAEIILDDELLAAMEAGKTMIAAYRRLAPEPVRVGVSLKGFAAAREALIKENSTVIAEEGDYSDE